MTPLPPTAELRQLLALVRRESRELEPALLYLFGTVRRLSQLTLEGVLDLPPDEELTLETYHKVVTPGTMPEDLLILCRQRLTATQKLDRRRRITRLINLLERFMEIEARSKVERLLGNLSEDD